MNEAGRVEITIALEEAGERLDRVLAARIPGLSRTRAQALILAGLVGDGAEAHDRASLKLAAGERVVVDLPPPEAAEPAPEDIPLRIVHEDAHLVVIDKQAGLVVHPAPGNWTGTLVNALLHHCGDSLSGIGGVRRPGIVHRLDKDTSGLMVVAKTDAAHRGLAAQFADHGRQGSLERVYLALAWGAPVRACLVVDAPIGRDPRHRQRMAVVPGGKAALTRIERREVFGPKDAPVASLLACTLETGRTHQIRVHCAHIHHPLMGDELYASGFKTKAVRLSDAARSALDSLGRQALHAAILGFLHPISRDFLHFSSEPPSDFARLHQALAAM